MMLYSGASSLQPEESSIHGSTAQLAGSSITTDSTLEMKKEAEDPHLSATLPREQGPTYQYMSANVLSGQNSGSSSDNSGHGYFSGRSQSQPLETAMWDCSSLSDVGLTVIVMSMISKEGIINQWTAVAIQHIYSLLEVFVAHGNAARDT